MASPLADDNEDVEIERDVHDDVMPPTIIRFHVFAR